MFTLFSNASEPNAADEAYARTMAFTTLMMFQLFNVYNCRSLHRSAFSGFFENRWLLIAVACSLLTHVCVIYVPTLQAAFQTVPLTADDWLITAGVGAMLLVIMELHKLAVRSWLDVLELQTDSRQIGN